MPRFHPSPGLLLFCMPFRALANWVYASGCVICGRDCGPVLPLCTICWRRLPTFLHPICPVCNHFVPGKQPHSDCRTDRETPSLVWISGMFDAGYRPLVHALKYEHQQSIGEFFGRRFGRRLRKLYNENDNPPLIVPVPLHPAREKHRGYNQSSAIATGLARTSGFPFEKNLLIRVRRTRDQTKLSPEKRLANVRDAFRISHPGCFHQQQIILVDDVMTTGATLRECTRIIAADGAAEVQAVVIALARPAKVPPQETR